MNLKHPIVLAAAIVSAAAVLIVLVLTGHWGDIWGVVSPLATAGVALLVLGLRKRHAATDEKVSVVAESTERRDRERVVEKAVLTQTLNEMKTTTAIAASAATAAVVATNTMIKAMPDESGPKDNA